MEYCHKGSLYHRLHNVNKKISWEQRWNWAHEIAFGIAYLHENDIVHNNLACRNVLLNQHYHAKISDFELSVTTSYAPNSTGGQKEAFAWTAPERLSGNVKGSFITDIYSFSVVLWEIASRQNPLSGEELKGLESQVKICKVVQGYREPIPKDTPLMFKNLIEACRNSDPKKRPTAREIQNCFKIFKTK